MMSHRIPVELLRVYITRAPTACYLFPFSFFFCFFFVSFFLLYTIDMSTHNEWTILEKLLLTQAVYKYGENMWFQVARVIKQHDLVQLQGIERAPDFYSQKVSF